MKIVSTKKRGIHFMITKEKIKLVSMILAIFMVFSIVAACGSETTTEEAPKETEKETEKAEDSGSKVPTTIEELAMYEGEDREQILSEAAKKEGTLNLYTSAPLEDMQKIVDAYTAKYGVEVSIWRAGSEKVLQRIVTEAQGGRFDFDVVETNGPELEALSREGVLQEVASPYYVDLIPEAIPPHKQWIATRLNIFVQAYNTDKVKKEDLPTTYEDLLDPKWKGQLAIEAEDLDWFAGVIKDLGDEEKGLQLFRDIKASSELSVRKGHTLLTNLVASGEVPLALTVYNYKAEQLKQKGAPLEWFAIEPAIARPNGVAVSAKPKNPASAILFHEFMISTEGQNKLNEMDFVPTSNKVETNLNDMKLKFVDPAIILDENEKWTKLWNEIILGQ
jgi:iron(III) transport system substrate-binding protein